MSYSNVPTVAPDAVFCIDCTGDAVANDRIRFIEAVFAGSFKSPKCVGHRTITGLITRESYGEDKQQHTFTIEVESCDGIQPIAAGTSIRRKGRNLYRLGTLRAQWTNEASRNIAADEKHDRGGKARQARALRTGS